MVSIWECCSLWLTVSFLPSTCSTHTFPFSLVLDFYWSLQCAHHHFPVLLPFTIFQCHPTWLSGFSVLIGDTPSIKLETEDLPLTSDRQADSDTYLCPPILHVSWYILIVCKPGIELFEIKVHTFSLYKQHRTTLPGYVFVLCKCCLLLIWLSK